MIHLASAVVHSFSEEVTPQAYGGHRFNEVTPKSGSFRTLVRKIWEDLHPTV